MKIIICSSHIMNTLNQLAKPGKTGCIVNSFVVAMKKYCKCFICSLRSSTRYFSGLISNVMVLTVRIINNHRHTDANY